MSKKPFFAAPSAPPDYAESYVIALTPGANDVVTLEDVAALDSNVADLARLTDHEARIKLCVNDVALSDVRSLKKKLKTQLVIMGMSQIFIWVLLFVISIGSILESRGIYSFSVRQELVTQHGVHSFSTGLFSIIGEYCSGMLAFLGLVMQACIKRVQTKLAGLYPTLRTLESRNLALRLTENSKP